MQLIAKQKGLSRPTIDATVTLVDPGSMRIEHGRAQRNPPFIGDKMAGYVGAKPTGPRFARPRWANQPYGLYEAELSMPPPIASSTVKSPDFDATMALHPTAAAELVTKRAPIAGHVRQAAE